MRRPTSFARIRTAMLGQVGGDHGGGVLAVGVSRVDAGGVRAIYTVWMLFVGPGDRRANESGCADDPV
jgi:hypothetical protein